MERNELLHLLRTEPAFFESGGYANPFRSSWRPTLLIRDSPTCLTAGFAAGERCRGCKLLSLVPPEKIQELIPCHHIPLNAQAETISSFYRNGSQESLDRAFRDWINTLLQQLENR